VGEVGVGGLFLNFESANLLKSVVSDIEQVHRALVVQGEKKGQEPFRSLFTVIS
jgi:hypothetical protein